jgi:hypothetical protein
MDTIQAFFGTHNYYLNMPLINLFITVKERYGHENTV